MAVAFDAIWGGTGSTLTAVNNVVDIAAGSTITVGSGSNRAILFLISIGNPTTARTVTSVTWDNGATNQAATLVNAVTRAGAVQMRTEIWGLVAPTSGNKRLTINLSGIGEDIYTSAVSWTGVDQTGGATSFPNSTTGASGNTTLTVTSATGDAVTAAWTVDVSNITSVNNTQIYINNGGAVSNGAGNRAAGAATVTLTASPNQEWCGVGTSIKAAAAAGNPFVQTDWPLPQAHPANLNPLLRNWALPFNQNLIGQDKQFAGAGQFKTYDWPLPGRQPERRDLRVWVDHYNANLIGLDLLPNRQQDWPLSARQATYRQERPDLRSWSFTYNPNLVGKDSLPFSQDDWPLSARQFSYRNERPDLRQWAFTYNPNLVGQDVLPLNQDDWPLASRIQYRQERPDLRSWTFTYNPNLIGQDSLPFRQQDWPVWRAPVLNPTTWILGLQLPLLPTGQSPFVQTDWPNPTGAAYPLALRSWFFTYNPNLVGKDSLPFRQTEWPLSSRQASYRQERPDLRQWAFTYNPNLVGKDSLPFRQTEWPVPRPQAPAAIGWQISVSLPLITPAGPNPFVQTDWPLPSARPYPVDLRGWTTWYNRNLPGRDQLPNRQQDWPLGRAKPYPVDLRTTTETYNPNLVNRDSLPFRQTDWPLYRALSLPAVAQLPTNFIVTIPVPIPPPPVFPPTSRIIAVDNAYGSDGLARTIIQTPAPRVMVNQSAVLFVTASPWVQLNAGFSLLITKPDQTTLTLTPPLVRVGTQSVSTWAGTFEPGVYLVAQLFPGVLDQAGGWRVQVVAEGSAGPIGFFTVWA